MGMLWAALGSPKVQGCPTCITGMRSPPIHGTSLSDPSGVKRKAGWGDMGRIRLQMWGWLFLTEHDVLFLWFNMEVPVGSWCAKVCTSGEGLTREGSEG